MLALVAAVTLRIATLAPPGSDWETLEQRAAKDVNTRTGGNVSITFVPVGIDHDQADLLQQMAQGKLDGAELTSDGLEQIDPSIAVLELPMMFDSIDVADYVRAKMWPLFQKRLLANGFVLLGQGERGWQYLFSSSPIRSIGDLKSLKLWLRTGDPIATALVAQLGVTGTALPLASARSAMASQSVGACYGALVAAWPLRWRDVTKYQAAIPINLDLRAVVITTASSSAISAVDEKTLIRRMNLLAKELRKALRRDADGVQRDFERHGVKTITPDAALEQAMCKASQATWKSLAASAYSPPDLTDVLQERAGYFKTSGGAPRSP